MFSDIKNECFNKFNKCVPYIDFRLRSYAQIHLKIRFMSINHIIYLHNKVIIGLIHILRILSLTKNSIINFSCVKMFSLL